MGHRKACALIALLGMVAACDGQTLKQLLLSQQIPTDSFSAAELAETVQGAMAGNSQRHILAYQKLEGEQLSGPPILIERSKSGSALLRSHGDVDEECTGSVVDLSFIGSFTVLATHINPSAGCLLIYDQYLTLHATLFGYAPVEVDRNFILIQENAIHFAPMHPVRLQSLDLLHGDPRELYPLAADPLRQRRAAEQNGGPDRVPRRGRCGYAYSNRLSGRIGSWRHR